MKCVIFVNADTHWCFTTTRGGFWGTDRNGPKAAVQNQPLLLRQVRKRVIQGDLPGLVDRVTVTPTLGTSRVFDPREARGA